MSDALSRTEFENLLDEYIRHELPEDKRKSFDRYLDENPEAREELAESRALLEANSGVGQAEPPEGLAGQAAAGFRHRIAQQNQETTGGHQNRRFFRPVMTWGIAASIILAIGLAFLPSSSPLVFAQVITNLSKVESLHVEGWIRGENGAMIPYRQWLLADGTLRAEVGRGNDQRVVVVKKDERLILDRDGRLYRDLASPRMREDLGSALRSLQSKYQGSGAEREGDRKIDLGDVVRFERFEEAMVGKGPSNRKWVLEVDKETALPVVSQLHQLVDGSWLQITDLHYSDFNVLPSRKLFELRGKRLPLADADRQKFWFELFISPSSIQTAAVHVPEGGIQVSWPAEEDEHAGISGGITTFRGAGISTFEFQNLDLNNVIPTLTGHQSISNPVAQQLVTLVVRTKNVLPWEKKLEPILAQLGLTYELKMRETVRKRFVFQQDGRDLAPSEFRFARLSVVCRAPLEYEFMFERQALQNVVINLVENCRGSGMYAPGDTLEFIWEGAEEEDPFRQEVDLEFNNPQTTLQSNLEFLKDRFGVSVEIQEEKVKIREIELKKG